MSDIPKNVQTSEGIDNPAIIIVWDAELVSEEVYARVVEAVGNVVRAHGGLGVTLLRPSTFGAAVEEGVLI